MSIVLTFFKKNIESKCKIVYDRGSCTRDIKKGGGYAV